LNILLPDVFADADQFNEFFNLDTDDADAKKTMLSQLHKILRPFMLRRLKVWHMHSLQNSSQAHHTSNFAIRRHAQHAVSNSCVACGRVFHDSMHAALRDYAVCCSYDVSSAYTQLILLLPLCWVLYWLH
jgi:hypothetical protein